MKKIKKTIQLKTEGDAQTKTFHIRSKLNEGASVICYEGYFKSSTKGTLREFCPRDLQEFLTRSTDNQLIFKEDEAEIKKIFRDRLNKYLSPYRMFLEKQRKHNKLSTFIPQYEIFYGANNETNSAETAYIWTQEQPVETFEKICGKIHKRPNYKPETNLFIILQAMRSLTECVCLLHRDGLIHRDIKPSNFGFKERYQKILPDTIELFDIDTICFVDEELENVVSAGYTEPEIYVESANNLTDIYSIGATLFSAIVGSIYDGEDINNLKYQVDNSKLITASEINSAPRLRATLTEILQKTLCRREERFQTCEELLEKIKAACFYLMPTELAEKSRNGEKWVLKEVEKSFNEDNEKKVLTAIQYHLYENPLYKTMLAGEKNLNVLIFGLGNYGQKFLDICLQVGQMIDINLNVVVVSNDLTDKEIYLKDRPALKDFFDIDTDKATCGQSYGKISFVEAAIAKNEIVADSDIVDRIILDSCIQSKLHYIFIALGNDTLNKNTAVACRDALKELEINCRINFAQEKNLHTKPWGILPVYVRGNLKLAALHSEIERMAFNAHLVWEWGQNLNFNYDEVRKNFRAPYNYDSCISNVLSIKYKLHSVGIDIKKVSDFEEAAKIFVEKNLHNDAKTNTLEYDLRNKLIWVEHKRWVVEKICGGWTQRKFEECSDGDNKDKKRRTHVCILPSRADRLLHDNYRAEDWDIMSQREMETLDELDKMSVQYHQFFRSQIKEPKYRSLLQSAIEDIVAELSGHQATAYVFSELKVCLQDILNGDKNKVLLYKNLKKVFEQSLGRLNAETRENIKERLLPDLENKMKPILESMSYIDYKQKDTDLIDNIPFILTYSTNITQVIPYIIGDNSEMFSNVASATVIKPAKIIYLAWFEKKNEFKQFKNSLSGLINYLNRKNLRADIKFLIAFNGNSSECLRLESEIRSLGIKKIKSVNVFPINEKNKIGVFKNSLKSKNKSLLLFEKNHTYLSGLLEGEKFYDDFAAYSFNSVNMKFTSSGHCEFLNYINKKIFITANDLTEFKSSRGKLGEQPTFFEDYKILWRKYREDTDTWKKLCNLLDDHSQKADVIAKLKTTYTRASEVQEYTYLLPQECLRTVEDKVLKVLKDKKIIEDYAINIGVANSFAVTIKDPCNNESEYKRLFGNPYAFFQSDAIKVAPQKNTILIYFDNLKVENFNLLSTDRKVLNLLNFFAARNYLTNLNSNDLLNISFTYATRTIKNLLTVAGKILEIYVFHAAKNSGYFDDVVSNFEPNWNDTEVKNEIDCIVIKNFRVLIIECKARSKIEQDFHHKLSAISSHFGINCTPVLIADTPKLYEGQLERGVVMENVVVWQEDEVEHIAETLKKIVEGNYKMSK